MPFILRLIVIIFSAYSHYVVAGSVPIDATIDTTADVVTKLQGYEWQLDELAFNTAGTQMLLMQIIQDPQQMSFIRRRAMVALSLFDNETNWQFINEILLKSEVDTEKSSTIDAMCAAFRKSRPIDLSRVLQRYLRHQNPHMRLKTAACLMGLKNAEAQQIIASALTQYQRTRKPAWEQQALQRFEEEQ